MFVIGGADGLDERVLAVANAAWRSASRPWPHALVRAMLAEQIYRAATLMAGGAPIIATDPICSVEWRIRLARG